MPPRHFMAFLAGRKGKDRPGWVKHGSYCSAAIAGPEENGR